jgi:hypothetical protein
MGPSGILNQPLAAYPLREELRWLWRNIRGVRKTNPCTIQPLPEEALLNPIRTCLRLGFVGDIMEMRRKSLNITPAVPLFFQDCDYLIGNLEGTITKAGKPRLDAQRHDPSILDTLAGLFPPDRTFLSVANNHAGDFPPAVFRQFLDLLQHRGYHLFGLRTAPCAHIAGCVQVAAASQWSNRPCTEIASLASLTGCSGTPAFRIAYPHWGYELERFPRPEVVQAGGELLQMHDAVLGHHPHFPQPLTAIRQGDTMKLLAFSLGDFCTGLPFKKFQDGMVCKLDIGPGAGGLWQIGAVRWRFTKVSPAGHDAMQLGFVLPTKVQ